jgi:hypothetical protein
VIGKLLQTLPASLKLIEGLKCVRVNVLSPDLIKTSMTRVVTYDDARAKGCEGGVGQLNPP